MSSSPFWEEIHRYPGLAELAYLTRLGSGWVVLPARILGVDCLYGVREGEVVTETLTVRSPQDATAVRMRNEDYLSQRRSSARGVLWEYTGTLADAIEHLCALPGHDDRLAPKLLRPASSMFTLCDNS